MPLRDELVQLTKDLIAIPSVSDDAAGRAAVIDYIEQYCRRLPGVYVKRHESNGVPSLVAAFDAQHAKALVLNAHVDVVPAKPEQFEPFERDGRIYGRGAQDMKAAGAAMLVLLKELAESGQRPNIAWQFVTDEEIGGEDGARYLLQGGYTADFFIAGEPTDLKIVVRAKGMLQLTITQQGNPAHGSRPWDGTNPIVPMAQGVLKVLERYPIPEAAIWRTTVTPAVFQSGDAHNRVPVDAQVALDIRRVPEEDPEEILQFVQECFPDAEIDSSRQGSPLYTKESNPEVGRLVRALETITGQAAEFAEEHFGSDARYYSEAGMAAVCFGPHGAGLHSHEEWVSIDSLVTYYEVLRRLASEY
ncbi:MAG TPA: M20/M25/M40 family metallo-hydrolase [Herpetosiphonaceae bacterium]